MSLLGDPFDTIIALVSSFISAISGFANAILNLVGSILIFLGYLLYIIEGIISIILNPYLLALFLVGSAFWYATLTSRTRKELLLKTGIYYKYIFEAIPKIMNAMLTLIVRVIVGIIDMI